MGKLLVITISLGVLWSGYWFVGSNAVERGLTTWLSDSGGRSWAVEYSSLNTSGFPNRFDTTLRDLTVADQNSGLAWAVPFFQIFALSYKPNHIIAVWPNQQTITLASENLAVTSDRMRGSVVFKPETALTLDRSSVEVSNLKLQSTRGWSTSMRTAQFSTRQSAGLPDTHDVFFQTQDLRLSERFMAFLDPKGDLPDEFEMLSLDAAAAFTGPWDRYAVERRLPILTELTVKKLQFTWGELDFAASGNLTADASGFLSGKLEITAQNWRGIYQILLRLGIVQGGFAGAVESILQLMALETEDADILVTEWVFADGNMRLGAIPLGPAPRLIRR